MEQSYGGCWPARSGILKFESKLSQKDAITFKHFLLLNAISTLTA